MKKTVENQLAQLLTVDYRRTCRLMLGHCAGEKVDLSFLGDWLAARLYRVEGAAEWRKLKKATTLARRRIAYRLKRERMAAQKENKRAYMRIYMRNYRKRGTTPSQRG